MRQAGWGNGEQVPAGTVAPAEKGVEDRVDEVGREGEASLKKG